VQTPSDFRLPPRSASPPSLAISYFGVSIVIAVLVGRVFAPAGCGEPSAAPVDSSRAQEALKATLESWKKGDPIESLKDAKPSIVAQDFDWMAGTKLVDFRVSGDGKPVGANLYVPVSLTLKPSSGKEVQKKVTYVVGTSPYLTVFRDFK
jgi:hypothetical protein